MNTLTKKILFTVVLSLTAISAHAGGVELGIFKNGKSGKDPLTYSRTESFRAYRKDSDSDSFSNFGFFGIKVGSENKEGPISTAFKAPVKTSVIFDGLSADGKDILVRLQQGNDALKKQKFWLSNRSFWEYRFKLTVNSCDGETVNTPFEAHPSLENLISRLDDTRLLKSLTCDFSISNVIPLDVFNDAILKGGQNTDIKMEEFIATAEHKYQGDSIYMRLNADGDLIFVSRPNDQKYLKLALLFEKGAGIGNLTALEIVRKNAKSFIEVVKGYGDLLLKIDEDNETQRAAGDALPPGPTQAETDQSLEDYIRDQKDFILGSLSNIRANFAALEVLQQLTVQRSINDAYDYVHGLEVKVRNRHSTSPLDSVVKVPVK